MVKEDFPWSWSIRMWLSQHECVRLKRAHSLVDQRGLDIFNTTPSLPLFYSLVRSRITHEPGSGLRPQQGPDQKNDRRLALDA